VLTTVSYDILDAVSQHPNIVSQDLLDTVSQHSLLAFFSAEFH
jgi:hypothetical protein